MDDYDKPIYVRDAERILGGGLGCIMAAVAYVVSFVALVCAVSLYL